MQLLSGAFYGGAWDEPGGFVPMAYGTFNRFKAVYRDGFITCATGSLSQYYWQAALSPDIPPDTIAYSFELKKNSAYVVQQPSWGSLPSECSAPPIDSPTGDIICNKTFTLAQGDRLTPTWYEASRQVSTADNDGLITIDLYGLWDQVRAVHVCTVSVPSVARRQRGAVYMLRYIYTIRHAMLDTGFMVYVHNTIRIHLSYTLTAK